MATFLAWYRGAQRRVPLKSFLYVSGDPALTTEVEEYVRSRFDSITFLEGKGLAWPAVDEALRGRFLHGGLSLMVVRAGDVVPDDVWARLLRWRNSTDRLIRETRHVLVTTEVRWNARDSADPRHPLFVGLREGGFVDCKPFPVERQVEYARLKLTRTRPAVQGDRPYELLVERCGGDLQRLRSECAKLDYVAGHRPISEDLVDVVVVPSPGELFVDALLRERKSEAAARAPYVGSLPFVLGSLEWNLHALVLVRKGFTVHRKVADVATYAGLDPFVVIRLRLLARLYDHATVRRRYEALILLSRAIRQIRQPEEALLPLVARW